jgi:hypothetical protein
MKNARSIDLTALAATTAACTDILDGSIRRRKAWHELRGATPALIARIRELEGALFEACDIAGHVDSCNIMMAWGDDGVCDCRVRELRSIVDTDRTQNKTHDQIDSCRYCGFTEASHQRPFSSSGHYFELAEICTICDCPVYVGGRPHGIEQEHCREMRASRARVDEYERSLKVKR